VRRKGAGKTEEALARPGTNWLVPAGTYETLLETDSYTEMLIIFLPETLLEKSALESYGIDPEKVQLAYTGGFFDPMLTQIGSALQSVLGRPPSTVDQLFVDGMRSMLAARLIERYSVGGWEAPKRKPPMDPKRLNRVLAYIEGRLHESITLVDLAGEACLSPSHFCRLFQDAIGLSPHRYVTERRIQAAQAMLVQGEHSLAEVALYSGFSSQANFTRWFRKITGTTPGQYRDCSQRAPPSQLIAVEALDLAI
jgi:AraC-type DNA-binding domain-containing proteins